MPEPVPPAEGLRERCVAEALRVIEEDGVERLSLREVARRLGVSHQAPYKHFASRDHILAEAVARSFADFARWMDAPPEPDDPHEALVQLGRRYLRFAREHPARYRLMFGTPLPDIAEHGAMMANAQHAYSLLRGCVSRLRTPADGTGARGTLELDALFVWSTIHGLASILESDAGSTLEIPESILDGVGEHAMRRIGQALDESAGPSRPAPTPEPIAGTRTTEIRQMGIVREDFFRLLPRAMGEHPYEVDGDTVRATLSTGALNITLGPQRERRFTAVVAMPYVDVTFDYDGVPEDVRAAFERHFHLRFMRGLG